MAKELTTTFSRPFEMGLNKYYNLPKEFVISTKLSARYEQLMQTEKFTDVEFHFEDNITIKSHKLILSAASSVFEAMFYGPMRETKDVIQIDDVSPEMFRALIEYIYLGRIDFLPLTLEQAVELYYCAQKYMLEDLSADSLEAVHNKLHFSNILCTMDFCAKITLTNLFDICITFFVRCCLSDRQFMNYVKNNYFHVSKECIKMIIMNNHKAYSVYVEWENVRWFVKKWCQYECLELGLAKDDFGPMLKELNLEANVFADSDAAVDETLLQNDAIKAGLPQNHLMTIERNCFKACQPFIVDYDTCERSVFIKCNRFIALHGIIMNARQSPRPKTDSLQSLYEVRNSQQVFSYPPEYYENLHIEISRSNLTEHANGEDYYDAGHSDDSDNEFHFHREFVHVHQNEDEPPASTTIWQHKVNNLLTTYGIFLNICWNGGVILAPNVEYRLKLTWNPMQSYLAEYPRNIYSNTVTGIEFRDENAHFECGSIIKGLRFINLV